MSDETHNVTARSDGPVLFRLYHLKHVQAALGVGDPDVHDPTEQPDIFEPPPATEQGERIGSILARGEAGCWRRLAHATIEAVEAIAALRTQAPHLTEFLDLVLRHVQGRFLMGLPVSLPPILLVGPPGAGKTWLCRAIARCLGLPFRSYAMNAATLSEGLSGNHGTWRNAGPGLVARTLLQERFANPLIFVDELDKAASHGWNGDPYRPFYTLLEPENATEFTDEYLQFPMNASAACFLMTANSLDPLPAPILDRLTVLTVPEMDDAQRRTVSRSIFVELNGAMNRHFAPVDDDVLDALVGCHPRHARASLIDAMMRAAAEGRRHLRADDLRVARAERRRRMGF